MSDHSVNYPFGRKPYMPSSRNRFAKVLRSFLNSRRMTEADRKLAICQGAAVNEDDHSSLYALTNSEDEALLVVLGAATMMEECNLLLAALFNLGSGICALSATIVCINDTPLVTDEQRARIMHMHSYAQQLEAIGRWHRYDGLS